MAVIGLSKPYYAAYSATGGEVSYDTPAAIGKAVEVTIDVDDVDPVVLYADNGPAETASGFSGGTLTLTIDELSLAAAGAILGITPGSSTTPAGTTLTFSGITAAPYLGFGIVVKKMVSNSYKYLAVILHKVQFQTPGVVATTQGENVEFQTPELTATILRDDTSDHSWMTQGQFDTETDAVSFITGFFS